MKFKKKDRYLLLSERVVAVGTFIVIDIYVKKGTAKKWLSHHVIDMPIEKVVAELQQRGWR